MSVNTFDCPRGLHVELSPTGLDSGRKPARVAKGATFFNRPPEPPERYVLQPAFIFSPAEPVDYCRSSRQPWPDPRGRRHLHHHHRQGRPSDAGGELVRRGDVPQLAQRNGGPPPAMILRPGRATSRWTAIDSRTRPSGRGPPAGTDHVLRGGMWFSNPGFCRSVGRVVGTPILRGECCGFRCAAGT